MISHWQRRPWRIGVFFGVLLAAAPAWAQASTDYEDLIRRGIDATAQEQYESAIAHFRSAHALRPSARTLRGIGLALHEARRYAESVEYLRQALADTRDPLTPEQREEAEHFLRNAESRIGRIVLSDLRPRTRTRVNGNEPRFDSEGRIVADPGPTRLRLEAPGYAPVEATVEVRSGQVQRFEPQWVSIERSPLPWLIVGGTALTGSIGTGVWWRGRHQELRNCEGTLSVHQACLNAHQLRRLRNAAIGLTAGLLTTGATLAVIGLLRSRNTSPSPGREAFVCAPSVRSVACELRF